MNKTFDLTWGTLYTHVAYMFGHWQQSHEFKVLNPGGGPLCVYPGWGQCFQVRAHLYMPFHHSYKHTRAHTPFTLWPIPPVKHTFPVFVWGGAAMVWNRPVFGRGQTLARPEGGRHSIPPPPREAMDWDPFWTSTCWENFTLDTLFRPFSTLQIGGRVFRLSQHARISLFLVPSFEGDLDSWTIPNELLTHMVQHMDGAEGNTF